MRWPVELVNIQILDANLLQCFCNARTDVNDAAAMYYTGGQSGEECVQRQLGTLRAGVDEVITADRTTCLFCFTYMCLSGLSFYLSVGSNLAVQLSPSACP